jgi:hypothetical protein
VTAFGLATFYLNKGWRGLDFATLTVTASQEIAASTPNKVNGFDQSSK